MTEKQLEEGFAQIKAFQCRLCGEIFEFEPPDEERAECIHKNCPARIQPPQEL